MVPSDSKSSWILSGLCPGWVISIQGEHKTVPIILVWHHGLEQNEDSLLPGLLSWQLPPAITPQLKGQNYHVKRPLPCLYLGNGRLSSISRAHSQCRSKSLQATLVSWICPCGFFLLEFGTKPNTLMIPRRTPPPPPPPPPCKWEPFMRELIGTSFPKSVLLLNFLSWLKAQLSLIGFSQKLSKRLQHLPSLPYSFQFPGPVVPTSLIFLALFFSPFSRVLSRFWMPYFLTWITHDNSDPKTYHPVCYSMIFLFNSKSDHVISLVKIFGNFPKVLRMKFKPFSLGRSKM